MNEYKIIRIPKNRISAKDTKEYILDITNQKELKKLITANELSIYKREKGLGRPTKKERRLLDKEKKKYN